MHSFHSTLSWFKPDAAATEKRVYAKSHTVHIEGKSDLAVSAAKIFKGDPALYNPEDLLLSSLMSCHMMSYMYVCERAGVVLLAYADTAEAKLETYSDGSGKIVEVTLRPIVKLADESQEALALDLHKEAHKLCFIANSVGFKINIDAGIDSVKSQATGQK